MSEGYEPIEVSRVKMLLGKRALVKWELAPTRLGESPALSKLVRPQTHEKMHYTGVVLKCGLDMSMDIEVGDRIFFEQFSGFQKYEDQTHGRIAIVDESAILAVIPPRSEDMKDYPVVEDAETYVRA